MKLILTSKINQLIKFVQMKKLLTIIISALLICNISYSKDNPLKIFKKEILGGDAKKKMALAYDSLTKHKEILHYNNKKYKYNHKKLLYDPFKKG